MLFIFFIINFMFSFMLFIISQNEVLSSQVPPTLLSYTRQIASGLVYLGMKAFIHRDIAARNILVSECGTCKVSTWPYLKTHC